METHLGYTLANRYLDNVIDLAKFSMNPTMWRKALTFDLGKPIVNPFLTQKVYNDVNKNIVYVYQWCVKSNFNSLTRVRSL